MIRLRVAALVTIPLLAVAACGSSDSTSADKPSSSGTSESSSVSCSYPADGEASRKVNTPPTNPPGDEPTTLTISTNSGDVPITFDSTQAPCTVNSFVSLAQQGFYDNTTCHRMLTAGDYILQCGDPTATGTGGPGYTIPDELVPNDPRLQPCDPSGCNYPAGTIAMANRSAAGTGGSQFFLMFDDSPFPPNYTVFGHTDAGGLKVLKAIGAKGTANGSSDGPPKETVTITAVK